MWKWIYRMLAKVSGGPTFESWQAWQAWQSQYFEMAESYWAATGRESDLSRKLADAHKKLTALNEENDEFCLVLDKLLAEKAEMLEQIDEAREVHMHARQSVADGIRREARLNDAAARWRTACETMKQQRDEALEQLASIQAQTAKYVRT